MFRRSHRGFSGFAIWVVLGLALALLPVACGPTSTGSDSGDTQDAPKEMTSPG